MRGRVHLYGMLTALTVLWGLAFVGIKEALRELSPASLSILRFAIADACLIVVLLLASSARPRFRRTDAWRLAVLGMCGVPIYHLAINWGEQRTGASIASLIVATAPVMVALLSAAVLREATGARRWLGIVLAFGGVTILAMSNPAGSGSTSVSGVLVTALSPAAWAVYTIVAKPLTERASSIQVTAGSMLVGSLGLVPFLSSQTVHEIGALSAENWAWMILLGAGSSVIGYFIFVWALGRMEATKVSVFLYAVPVVALFASWLILEEDLGPSVILAAAMVIAGVVLAQQEKLRDRPGEALPLEEPLATPAQPEV